MKKKLAATLSVVLILGLAVLGILAYLTDTDSDVNVMTLGNVQIEQIEQERNSEGELVDFTQGKPLYPAVYEDTSIPWAPQDTWPVANDLSWRVVADNTNVVDKFITVKNAGKSDAYVRTIIAFESTPTGEGMSNLHYVVNYEGWDWTYIDGYYAEINDKLYFIMVATHKEKVAAKTTTTPNFKQIYLDKAATNELVAQFGDTYEILALSQAVQTEGFPDAATALNTAFGNVNAENIAKWFDGTEIPVAVATADALVAAIADGKDVYLTADVDMGATQVKIPAGKDVTLDLNGKKITGTYADADHYAMFTIPSGAALTVEGNGEVKASTQSTENNRSLAIFLNDGNLTINGGTYNINDASEDKTWIIATIVDNRTKGANSKATLTVNGGDFSVSGKAINLFRNYPQQGGTATIIVNDGTFNDKDGATAYIWNQEAGTNLGELYFNGGTYDAGVVYEDYNGQSDIHIADGVTINAYSGNN